MGGSQNIDQNLPEPIRKVVESNAEGQTRVVSSLTWQGWIQTLVVFVPMIISAIAIYVSLRGDVDRNAIRTSVTEKEISDLQSRDDRTDTHVEGLLKDTNEKLDRIKAANDEKLDRIKAATDDRLDKIKGSVDRLIGKLDSGNHSDSPAALNSITQHSGLISAVMIENQIKAAREYARRLPKSSESNYVAPATEIRGSHKGGAD